MVPGAGLEAAQPFFLRHSELVSESSPVVFYLFVIIFSSSGGFSPTHKRIASTKVKTILWCPGRDLNPQDRSQRILSPSRIPIPPPGRTGLFWRPDPELNRGTRFCRPLRNHSAIRPRKRKRTFVVLLKWSGRRGSDPRPQPWQGCALPLSYSRKWWLRPGSNRRHKDFQSSALPTELPSHIVIIKLVGAKGFEPLTLSV